MTYQLIEDGKMVVRAGDNAWIPADPDNRDYQEFLRWQKAGGVAKQVPPLVPATTPAPLTPAEKLKAAGLTVEELKALLAS